MRSRSASRSLLNHGRPASFSAIQLFAYVPFCDLVEHLLHLALRVASVTMRGPPV